MSVSGQHETIRTVRTPACHSIDHIWRIVPSQAVISTGGSTSTGHFAIGGSAVYADVLLVRHAQSVPPTADGPDEFTRPLTSEGLRQASDLSKRLIELRPSALWSSPYRRAIQTVQPAAQALGLPVQCRGDLREWDDGLPHTGEWKRYYAQSWADPSLTHGGGESLDQLTARAHSGLRELARDHRGHTVLVASHGMFITRALLGFGSPVDWRFWQRMPMPAIYRLHFADPLIDPVVTGIDQS
jgi:2,3-bisphosphoglycerate-dependent phosphoglycerate mutase